MLIVLVAQVKMITSWGFRNILIFLPRFSPPCCGFSHADLNADMKIYETVLTPVVALIDLKFT